MLYHIKDSTMLARIPCLGYESIKFQRFTARPNLQSYVWHFAWWPSVSLHQLEPHGTVVLKDTVFGVHVSTWRHHRRVMLKDNYVGIGPRLHWNHGKIEITQFGNSMQDEPPCTKKFQVIHEISVRQNLEISWLPRLTLGVIPSASEMPRSGAYREQTWRLKQTFIHPFDLLCYWSR